MLLRHQNDILLDVVTSLKRCSFGRCYVIK